MTAFHAGAQLERPPGRKYLAALHFAEIALRPPLPKPKTLARWRQSLPEGFQCSLVVPRQAYISPTGPMRFDDTLEEAFAWLLEAVEAVQPRAIVLATGSEITTGQRDRDRLASYVSRFPRVEGRALVWAPSGLWEADEARRQARRMDVVYGFDPLEDPVPPGPMAYARLRALGGRQRFTEGMIFDVLERLADSDAEEAFVAFESSRSFREARLMQQLVASAAGQPMDEGLVDDELEDEDDEDEDDEDEDEDDEDLAVETDDEDDEDDEGDEGDLDDVGEFGDDPDDRP